MDLVPAPRSGLTFHAHGSGTLTVPGGPMWFVNERGDALICGNNNYVNDPALSDIYLYGSKSGRFLTPQPFPIPASLGGQGTHTQPGSGGALLYGYMPGITVSNNGSAIRIDADRKVYAVGKNETGEWGGGALNGTVVSNWEYLYSLDSFTSESPRYMSTGNGATLLLMRNGDVWVTGASFYSGSSVRGDGSEALLNEFYKIQDDCVWAETFDSGSLVVKADGRLLVTGSEAIGRFGLGTSTNMYNTWQQPAGWNTNGGFVKARMALDDPPFNFGSCIALKRDGTVWFTGANITRLSGVAANNTAYTSLVFVQIPGLSRIIDIALTRYSAHALDEDGNVWSWGDTHTGQGSGQFPTPTIIVTDAIAISGTGSTGIAAKNGDAITTWGVGPGLGNGRTGSRLTPRPIAVPTPSISGYGQIIMGIPSNRLDIAG